MSSHPLHFSPGLQSGFIHILVLVGCGSGTGSRVSSGAHRYWGHSSPCLQTGLWQRPGWVGWGTGCGEAQRYWGQALPGVQTGLVHPCTAVARPSTGFITPARAVLPKTEDVRYLYTLRGGEELSNTEEGENGDFELHLKESVSTAFWKYPSKWVYLWHQVQRLIWRIFVIYSTRCSSPTRKKSLQIW